MSRVEFDNSPVEPAHPMTVSLYEHLVKLYTHIRDKYQLEIDKAFDRVSQQIGFVVVLTVPVVLEMKGKGAVKSINMGAEHLRGTIFDRELSGVLKPLYDDPFPLFDDPIPLDTTYSLYLFWHEALKLRLRTEWMEPAHIARRVLESTQLPTYLQTKAVSSRPRPYPEPVHWFDPSMTIATEEAVLIAAIDNVYPDLRLGDRIVFDRTARSEREWTGVHEPVHFRRMEPRMQSEELAQMLSEFASVLRRYGYR